MKIEVLFKNNSLCAHGRISLLKKQNDAQQDHVVRAVQLGMPLRTLAAGWNRVSPHLLAIKPPGTKHVDTTLCPSDEMMWLRTTLVYRDGIGWEVDECCESVSGLQSNLEEDFVYPEQVVEVITLAHKHAMQDEFLFFFSTTDLLTVQLVLRRMMQFQMHTALEHLLRIQSLKKLLLMLLRVRRLMRTCKSRDGSGQRIGLSQVTYPARWTAATQWHIFPSLNARLCKRGCGHELLSCHAVST